jgi:hypothetical protein
MVTLFVGRGMWQLQRQIAGGRGGERVAVWVRAPKHQPDYSDYLVGGGEQVLRKGYPQRLRGLEIDHHLEFGGLFDWQVCGFDASRDTIDIARGKPERAGDASPIGHQTASIDPFAEAAGSRVHSW